MFRPAKSNEIVVAPRSNSVVVQGSPGAMQRFADRLTAIVTSSDLADAVQVLSSITSALDSLPATGGQQPVRFEFSERAMRLLREHGAIAADEGYFRSMVHDGKHLAGNLDWKPVTNAADLAQIQTAAVGLALQASIKNLADAVARVETKVDVLGDLVRAGQVGEVLGHHRVLQRLLDMTADGTALSDTDWGTIDQLRPQITGALERTRHYVRTRMGAVDHGRLARGRAAAAGDLVESGLPDALGLLSVCEQNLAGWHHLRLARVDHVEPAHVAKVVADIEGDIAAHRTDDHALAVELNALVDRLLEPTGYEGLEPIHRNALRKHAGEIRQATERFATERRLELAAPDDRALPSIAQSVGAVKDRAVDGGKWVAGQVSARVPRRGPKDNSYRAPS